MENKLLLKTEMFGYSKKGVEDYILKLNREFDRRLSEAGADFAKAREEFEQKSKKLEEERMAVAKSAGPDRSPEGTADNGSPRPVTEEERQLFEEARKDLAEEKAALSEREEALEKEFHRLEEEKAAFAKDKADFEEEKARFEKEQSLFISGKQPSEEDLSSEAVRCSEGSRADEEADPGESSGGTGFDYARLRTLEEERPALEEEIRWLESERQKTAEQLKRAEEDNLKLTEELNARLEALRGRQEEPVFREEADPFEEDEEEVLLELEDENKSLREMNSALEQEYERIKERLRLAEQSRGHDFSDDPVFSYRSPDFFPARNVLSRPDEASDDSVKKALPAEEFYKVFSAIRFSDESFMDT